MQERPRPVIRPASGRRRPTRQQVARRRTFAAICVVLVVFLLWQFWPAGGNAGRHPVGDGERPWWNDDALGPGHGRAGREPHRACDLHGQGEPDLRSLLRPLPGRGGRHRGGHARLLDLRGRGDHPAQGLPTDPTPRPRACVLPRTALDQRRQDERIQLHRLGRGPHGLLAVRPRQPACVLGLRGPVRAGGHVLHLDVRADVPRAPLHGGRSVLWDRRQQVDHQRGRQLLRRSNRVHAAVPHRGPHPSRHPPDHEARGNHHREPVAAVQDRCVLGTDTDLYQHRGPARPAPGCGHHLEVLRLPGSMDERVAGDRARAQRADVEEGAGARDDPA